jgi:hypothetical protein
MFVRFKIKCIRRYGKIFTTRRKVFKKDPEHRISIPAYTIEQQWWQSGVSKNEMSLMSFIFKMMLVLYQSGLISGVISNIYWHARKWSSISFSHWQCPSDREFSFPRFVGLLTRVPNVSLHRGILLEELDGPASVQLTIVEANQHWSSDGSTKSYYCELLRASDRHVKPLVPAVFAVDPMTNLCERCLTSVIARLAYWPWGHRAIRTYWNLSTDFDN